MFLYKTHTLASLDYSKSSEAFWSTWLVLGLFIYYLNRACKALRIKDDDLGYLIEFLYRNYFDFLDFSRSSKVADPYR